MTSADEAGRESGELGYAGSAEPAAPRLSGGAGRGRAPEYMVRLEAFEGPLDLLMFLIRRAEVEITDIPIAEITEQYLGYLKQLTGEDGGGRRGRIDIEQAGEFLVMAATLMEIKSRMLSPRPERALEGGEEGGVSRSDAEKLDPRAELVRQLLDYKRYRDATDQLEDYRREWDHRFPSARVLVGKEEASKPDADAPPDDSPVDIEDLQLIDLIQAFARIVESVDFNRVGEHHVKLDETPVEVHGERIIEKLRLAAGSGSGEKGISFASLFLNRTRSEMIGVFLAILELVKQQRLLVQQAAGESEADAGVDAEIRLELAPEPVAQPQSEVVVTASQADASASVPAT